MRTLLLALLAAGCASVVDATAQHARDAGVVDAPGDTATVTDVTEAACVAPSSWPCPSGWVVLRAGGCAPAFRACPQGLADADACARFDPMALSSEGVPWGGVREGRDTPARDWRPEAGIARCPDAWTRRDDGTCDPNLSTTCPAGTGALPGGECTATGESACPAGDWPEFSGVVTRGRVLYVRPGAVAMGADGTRAMPLPTLDAAVMMARDGDRIALADGVYEFPSPTWPAGVSLAGRCAAHVTLRTRPVVTLSGDVAWDGVTVRGTSLSVARGATMTLSHAVLTETAARALAAEEATLELEDVWIHDLRVGARTDGAVTLTRNATARARRLAIARVGVCVSVDGVGTGSATGTAFSLEHGAFTETGDECVHSFASVLALTDVAFRGVRGKAIAGYYHDRITLERISFDDVSRGGLASAAALTSYFPGSVTGRVISVHDTETAVYLNLEGPVDLDELAVTGCTACAFVAGTAGDRARATLTRARIRTSDTASMLFGPGGAATLRACDVAPMSITGRGLSILASRHMNLTVEGSRLERLQLLGLGENASITLDHSVVTGAYDVDMSRGLWLNLAIGARARITHTLASSGLGSVITLDDGMELVVEDSIVRDVRRADERARATVQLIGAASARFTRVMFEEVGAAAFAAMAPGATLALTDVDVASMGSVPVFVTRGARADITRLSVDGALGAALLVDGDDPPPPDAMIPRVEASDLYVTHLAPRTVDTPDGARELSAAIVAQRGAIARVLRCTRGDAGPAFALSGARLSLTDVVTSDGMGAVGLLRAEADRASLALSGAGMCGRVRVDATLPDLPPLAILPSP